MSRWEFKELETTEKWRVRTDWCISEDSTPKKNSTDPSCNRERQTDDDEDDEDRE